MVSDVFENLTAIHFSHFPFRCNSEAYEDLFWSLLWIIMEKIIMNYKYQVQLKNRCMTPDEYLWILRRFYGCDMKFFIKEYFKMKEINWFLQSMEYGLLFSSINVSLLISLMLSNRKQKIEIQSDTCRVWPRQVEPDRGTCITLQASC